MTPEYFKRIEELADKIQQLSEKVRAFESPVLEDSFFESKSFRLNAIRTALTGERLVKELRDVISSTMHPVYSNAYMFDAAQALGIEVTRHDNGIVEIIFPCLMPHRTKGDNGFITTPLRKVLEKFTNETSEFFMFNQCDICITHIYNRKTRRQIRDHDNIEMKAIVDIVSAYLLRDDSGLFCNNHTYSEFGDEDKTRIEIMDCAIFPTWVLGHEKYTDYVAQIS